MDDTSIAMSWVIWGFAILFFGLMLILTPEWYFKLIASIMLLALGFTTKLLVANTKDNEGRK